jgi:hypothetical protein
MREKSSLETKTDRVAKPRGTGRKRGPVQREVNDVMAELVLKLSQKLEQRPERAREGEGRWQCVARPNRDRLTVGVDLGDTMEQLLHFGAGRGDAGRGAIADDATGFRGIFPIHGRRASGDGGRDPLGVGTRCRSKLRARSAGRQSATNRRAEATQT